MFDAHNILEEFACVKSGFIAGSTLQLHQTLENSKIYMLCK